MRNRFWLILLAGAIGLGCGSSHPNVMIDSTKPRIEVEFSQNTDIYYRMFKMLTCYPQMAIWIMDPDSGIRQTFYVTRKGGKKDWTFADLRPSAIPVWEGVSSHEKGLDIDGVSGATPTGESHQISWIVPEKFMNKKINIIMEANISFDYNEFYPKDAQPGQPGYNDVNGQPSVIWQAELVLGSDPQEVEPDLIGHGHVLGKDANIEQDLSKITTAKDMFHYIKVRYIPAKP